MSQKRRIGALAAAVASVLGGSYANAAIFVWQGPGGTTAVPTSGNWNDAANWSGGLPASAPTTELDFNGSGGTAYTATDDIAGSFSLNILKLTSTEPTVTEVINASAAANQLNFVNNGATGATINQAGGGAFDLQIGIVLTGTSAVTLSGAGTGLVSLSGVISGAAPLTISGSKWAFTNTAANTYTGATTISGGTVTVSAGATAINSALTVSGGTLNLNSTSATGINGNVTQSNGTITYQASNQIADSRNLTVSGGTFALASFSDTIGTLTISGGTISGAGGGVITPSSTTATGGTISAIVGGTGTFTKNGTGTTTLSGANTFTGATTVNQGVLQVNGGGRLAATTAVNIGGSTYGTFTLDNSGTNNADRLNDAGTVRFQNAGGTFNYTGNTAGSTEALATLANTGGIGVVNVTTQTGASAQLNIGSLSHTFGAIDFRGTGGTLGTAGNNPRVVFTTAPQNAGTIVAGWVTVGGSNFARYDAPNGLSAFTNYTALPASGLDGATNYEATGDVALTVGGSINSVKLNPSANQTIDFAGNNLTVNSGGILKVGTSTTTINGNGGTLSAPDEAVFHVYGGTLTVNAPLNVTGAAPRVTKPGSGLLTLFINGASPAWMANQVTFDGTLELNSTGGTQLVSGQVLGGGALVKSGPGTLQLNNAGNNYQGNTTINGGVVEMLSTSGTPNLNLNNNNGQLGNNGAGAVTINGATLKLTTVVGGTGGTVTGNIALGRGVTFTNNGGTLDLTNTVGGTLGGGTAVAGGVIVGGGSGNLPVTTGSSAAAPPAIIKFNGGQVGLSDPVTLPNWSNGGNALRTSSLSGNGPLRIELSNGAMYRAGNGGSGTTGIVTLPMAITYAGVNGGDPSSGPNATVNAGTSLTTGRISNDSFFTLQIPQGLGLEGALQFNNANAARAYDGNITLRGTASGNPAYVAFSGRSTGTGFGSGFAPAGGTNGINALYLGQGGDDTLTIQDGAIGSLDIRLRSDQNNHHSVVLDAKTVINAGGTLRFTQSISNRNVAGATNSNVAYHSVRNNIVGEGITGKESLVDIFLPFANTVTSDTNTAGLGGVEFTAAANLVVNGQGLGGLRVNGLTRPTALVGGADPVSNDLKVANLLSASRLALLTGSGGYLTPAPVGATFAFPVGGEWGAGVNVGLRTVNSNAGGADVSLPTGSTWGHKLHVDAGAELVATAVTVTSGLVSGFGTITSGAGANGLTIGSGATLGPGASAGVLTSNGDITLTSGSTFAAELNGAAAGTGYDQLNVVGAVTLQSPTLAATLGYDPTPGDALAIILNDGSDLVTGGFAGLPEGAALVLTNPGSGNSFTFNISYGGNADGGAVGNDVVLTAAVPEPGAIGLIGLAGAALAARRRRAVRR